MNTRILAALVTASCWALSLGGCGSAETDEGTATHQQAVGVRPSNELGHPLNPVTLQPADDYPIGYCNYVCSLSKRWVAMATQCKGAGVCDPDVVSQECTQERTNPVLGADSCVREVQRGCINPNFPVP